MEKTFERNGFFRRLGTMLRVDFRRMLHSRAFYIIVATCLVAPMLILIMTTVMDGTVSVDPQTGKETVTEGFDSVWQIIGSVSGSDVSTDAPADGGMSITSMCNINMVYFGMTVLVCLFVADDFRSGYSKNIFTVRAKKSDYVISKLLVCYFGGVCMMLTFFIGSMLGGAICYGMFELPFTMDCFGALNIVLCMLSKLALVGLFVPIYLLAGVLAKQRTWLSMVLSFGVGMLLFMMIPALTPINASIINVGLCLGGAAIFCAALGSISTLILNKTSLV